MRLEGDGTLSLYLILLVFRNFYYRDMGLKFGKLLSRDVREMEIKNSLEEKYELLRYI